MEDVLEVVKPSSGSKESDATKNKSLDFEALVVLEFAVNTKQAAVEWMIAKLQASNGENGADLSVTAMVMQHNQVCSAES